MKGLRSSPHLQAKGKHVMTPGLLSEGVKDHVRDKAIHSLLQHKKLCEHYELVFLVPQSHGRDTDSARFCLYFHWVECYVKELKS